MEIAELYCRWAYDTKGALADPRAPSRSSSDLLGWWGEKENLERKLAGLKND